MEVQVCPQSKKKKEKKNLLQPSFSTMANLLSNMFLCILSQDLVSCFIQELLAAGGSNIPRTIQEVVAHLACRLARWDDRYWSFMLFISLT